MSVYFISTFLIFVVGVAIKANKTKRKRKQFVIITYSILILVSSLRAPTIGLDLIGHYVRRFRDVAAYDWTNLINFSTFTGYEIGYCYFIKILSSICPDVQFYLTITSILIFGSVGYFVYKESEDVIMSTMLLIMSCTYYMCLTMIRQSMAFSFILVGYAILDYSHRTIKDYVLFLLFIILAALFHNSAILCISLIVFDKLHFTKKHIFYGTIAIILVYIFYQSVYSFLVGVIGRGSNNYERYITSLTEGRGNINLQSIISFLLTASSFLLGYYILVWKRKTVKTFRDVYLNEYNLARKESFLLYMTLIAAACRLLIFRMNIINRFTYYFIPYTFILYPYALKRIGLQSNKRIIRQAIYILFGLYFIWITSTYAGLLYGTVPYQFFWQ